MTRGFGDQRVWGSEGLGTRGFGDQRVWGPEGLGRRIRRLGGGSRVRRERVVGREKDGGQRKTRAGHRDTRDSNPPGVPFLTCDHTDRPPPGCSRRKVSRAIPAPQVLQSQPASRKKDQEGGNGRGILLCPHPSLLAGQAKKSNLLKSKTHLGVP